MQFADVACALKTQTAIDKLLPHRGEDVQQDAGLGADAAVLHAVLFQDGIAGSTVRVTPSTVKSNAPDTT